MNTCNIKPYRTPCNITSPQGAQLSGRLLPALTDNRTPPPPSFLIFFISWSYITLEIVCSGFII